ncbi:hypothetical protein BgiMline_004270, partial [Biomphalaria glabrata]
MEFVEKKKQESEEQGRYGKKKGGAMVELLYKTIFRQIEECSFKVLATPEGKIYSL